MVETTRVLLIHDDLQACRRLADALALHEDWAIEAVDVAAALRGSIVPPPFDAIVLAAAMQADDRQALTAGLRAGGQSAPLLCAEIGGGDESQVAVLLARIREHLPKADHGRAQQWSIGPFVFNPHAKRLGDPGAAREIRLTHKESAILCYLCQAGDVMVPRERLLREIWGYNPRVTTHTLETHVYRLRQKLERDPTNAEFLLTENGGYRLRRASKSEINQDRGMV